MKRTLMTYQLVLIFFLSIVLINLTQAGTTPPSLQSIEITPSSIDVTHDPAEITVYVGFTDNLSGVDTWSITLWSPSGSNYLEINGDPGLISGSTTEGIFEGKGTLPQGSEEGLWSANIVTVTDVAGNTANIDLSSHGLFLIQVGSSLEDITLPDVQSASISPSVVDVTDQDQDVVVTAEITDDLSGVHSASISFYSPSGELFVANLQWFYPYTDTAVTFLQTFTFPQFTEPGVWRPICYDYSVTPTREYSCMYVRDRVGNLGYVDLDAKGINMNIEVIGPPYDNTKPDVQSASISPSVVDVTDQDQDVVVTAEITDDLSGVNWASVRFDSPSGNHYVSAAQTFVPDTNTSATFNRTLTFPQYTEPGIWKPTCYDYSVTPTREYSCMYVRDRVGNGEFFDLDAKGINIDIEVKTLIEDDTIPDVQTISVTPTVLDISDGDADVVVTAEITDDLSGVRKACMYFYSPSGNRRVHKCKFFFPDTDTAVTFMETLTFPQYTEPGVWRPICYDYSVTPTREYSCMYVRDRVGNEGYVDLDAYGSPLALGVLSVPIDILFDLEPTTAEANVNTQHVLTATANQDGIAIIGAEVKFEIIEGPHEYRTFTAVTNSDGVAIFTYTGSDPGLDTIIASMDIENDGEIDAAKQAIVNWIDPVGTNLPPISDPNGPYIGPVTVPITLDGTGSSDPDNDPLTYEWNLGDGSPMESDVTFNHAYSTAGIYDICLTVEDGKGASDTECTYAVIYDPSAGFVTGGGWIYSNPGAYTVDLTLEGKANFGFVSKYKKKEKVPEGQTEFQFQAGNLNFHSTTYDWLVVTGSNYAKFKGAGTINGEGHYKFLIWAGDDTLDTFRIKIWEEDEFGTENIIYDNGFDQMIDGGSIVIHSKK